MTLGTQDKRKVALLAVLGLACAYLVYSNLLAGPSSSSPAPAPGPAPAGTAAPRAARAVEPQPEAPKRPAAAPSRGRSDEFHPVLRSKRPEDRIDPMAVDPTLKLDLLAKLQEQPPAGAGRNLFQFGTAPPPKAELPKGPEPKIVPKPGVRSPEVSGPPKPAAPPPPPPIALKYYGFSTERASGHKTAFFLDGEEILVAAEGETLKRRYRVVRIGPASVTMEDLDSKRQQPLPLAEGAGV